MSRWGDSITELSGRLARRLAGALRLQLQPLGLQPAQYAALAEIEAREGLTQAELVARLEVEQPGVARTLAGLVAGGWIERSALGRGRAQGLWLTERARAVLPRAHAVVRASDQAALGELSRTERAHLLDQLSQILAAPQVS
jgi:DNA-binding MarR family transcriptional regulator